MQKQQTHHRRNTGTRGTGSFAAFFTVAWMLAAPGQAAAQVDQASNARHPGSAVVTDGEHEFLIRIECRVPSRPELGFTTEPNRVTREDTGGQYNRASLRLRPWVDQGEETEDVIVNLGGAVAWLPRPASSGGVLSMEVELYPAAFERNGERVLFNYDMWQAGERSGDPETARFEANCTTRDPRAPAYRKLPG